MKTGASCAPMSRPAWLTLGETSLRLSTPSKAFTSNLSSNSLLQCSRSRFMVPCTRTFMAIVDKLHRTGLKRNEEKRKRNIV